MEAAAKSTSKLEGALPEYEIHGVCASPSSSLIAIPTTSQVAVSTTLNMLSLRQAAHRLH